MAHSNWYELHNTSAVLSPSLLVYPERILQNIRTMIDMAGGTEHLRPHIKTHKTAQIIEMQLEQGIQKFKCATIAEAELLAKCKAPDILLAMQPVGVDMTRFFKLMEKYPGSRFSALVDNPHTLRAFSEMTKSHGRTMPQMEDSGASNISSKTGESEVRIVSLWMDINSGMDRTGIKPNQNAFNLYSQMDAESNIEVRGLHAYDGHIGNTNVEERQNLCNRAFAPVIDLKERLESEGISVPGIVAGGSPTFPFHARRDGVDVSPGTTLLWDAGYGKLFPDMKFLPAAVLFTRVISKPSDKVICLDLGHKHLASEMPFPRVEFLGGDNVLQKGQSEEHFVLEVDDSEQYAVGDILYAIPVHICPTVAKYQSLQVVSKGRIADSWQVVARNQLITI